MKKVLIMGITGSFGSHVAQALDCRGWQLKALLRDPSRLPPQFQGVEAVQGDAGDIDSIRAAAEGVELIVYGVNPANYDWDGKAEPWLDNTARVAEEKGLGLLFPGNVYVLKPTDGPTFDEAAPIGALTNKGRIRQAMEARLRQASANGARVIILRMGDYIAADSLSSWLPHLIKQTTRGYRLSLPGPGDLKHSWAYLPDVAQTVAVLLERRGQLSPFSVFHFKGYQLSLNEIARTITELTGKPVRKSGFPWFVLQILAPFSVLNRGLVEMRYLWQNEVNLCEDKLLRQLGHAAPHTPFAAALLESGVLGEVDGAVSRLCQTG